MAQISVHAVPARTVLNLETALIAAANGGDKFTTNGKELLAIRNTDSMASHTVSLVVQQVVDGITPTDKVLTIPAGATIIVGPFPMSVYKDASGFLSLTYSSYGDISILPFLPV